MRALLDQDHTLSGNVTIFDHRLAILGHTLALLALPVWLDDLISDSGWHPHGVNAIEVVRTTRDSAAFRRSCPESHPEKKYSSVYLRVFPG